jgi:hypothetical protein
MLLWVTGLIVVVIYVYSLSSFALLRSDFTPDHNHLWCESSWQCFIATLRIGLLKGLGETAPDQYASFQLFGTRTIYEISFFIVITTIGLRCWSFFVSD